MKKLYFFLTLIMISWLSCQKPKPVVHKPNWTSYRKAYTMLVQKSDSAFYYFNKVASNAGDSLPVAMAYNNMAVIQSEAGDFYGAQESLTMSLKFLNESLAKDHSCLANDYNELGMNSVNLRNYGAAIAYYNKSRKFTNDPSLIALLLNNKALAYQENKDYAHALRIYEQIISNSKAKDIDYARTLTNLNITKWLLKPDYNPVPQLLMALHIRQQAADLWGQNSSYDHLADFYMRRKVDSALFYSRAMYQTAVQLNSPDDQLFALEKLIKAGPVAEAKRYFTRYQALNDSVQTARSTAKNQFALIRYNVEKSKADNLVLQKDNANSRYQLLVRNILLYATLLLFLLSAVIGMTWYKKRKQRLELKALNTIREHELRTSKKVHDGVANGIYQVITKIEHKVYEDQSSLLDDLDDIYERSRDISYEKPKTPDMDYPEKILRLADSFASDSNRVAVAGNFKETWETIDTRTKDELEFILQELLINMKKHSHAKRAAVSFKRLQKQLIIDYTDDGVGFPDKFKYGNGLTNTGNRIKDLGGTLTFETNLKKGVKIHISLPTA